MSFSCTDVVLDDRQRLGYVKLGFTLPEAIGVIPWYVALLSQGWDG